MRALAVSALAVALLAGACEALAGCKPAASAEAAYTGELLRCVDKAETLAESRACRAEVDKRWKVKP